MNQFEEAAGYEIENPPILQMQEGEPAHQLGRFFTVVSVEPEGIVVYDGSYGSGFSSLLLPAEIVSTLRVQKLDKTAESQLGDLITALASATAAANEQRSLLAEHSTSEEAVQASHRFFTLFLSGQIKGLAAKGVINPNVAVAMTTLATGVVVG